MASWVPLDWHSLPRFPLPHQDYPTGITHKNALTEFALRSDQGSAVTLSNAQLKPFLPCLSITPTTSECWFNVIFCEFFIGRKNVAGGEHEDVANLVRRQRRETSTRSEHAKQLS